MDSSSENSSPTPYSTYSENSPGGRSTSSKHSNHTLEQSNTISISPSRTEPPRKRLKTNENESETVTQSAENKFDDYTGNTVPEDELRFIIPTFENDPIDLEDLRLRLLALGINNIALPANEAFLTTENMFHSQDVAFPVKMESISERFSFDFYSHRL